MVRMEIVKTEKGRLWTVRATGKFAHFAGIPLGPDRMTMVGPSHSASVGIMRSIFGKYEARWDVESVSFLAKPDVTYPLRTNELDFSTALDPERADRQRSIHVASQMTQRTRTLLCNVDLVLRARIRKSAYARDGEDSIEKFDSMIDRRARRGHRQYQAYFGIRELTAHLHLVEDDKELPTPVDYSHDMGVSFYDIDMDDDERPAYLAPLRIEKGVLRYPGFDEVKRLGLRYQLARVV